MQKRIIVGVAGSDGNQFQDVAVLPETRAIDVLNTLKLTGFQLAAPSGGMFAHTDNIYNAVADGQKLFAAKGDVQAGA